MELGPLGPAPVQFGLSFHDGLDVRLRGGIRRAGGGISWGGGEGGDGSACVAGEADGFETGHFGGSVSGSAGNRALKESDAVGGEGGLIFIQSAIRLKTNSSKSS